MSDEFDQFENEVDELVEEVRVIPEASPTTKLERRRKIEDLFEEKRLKAELEEFA